MSAGRDAAAAPVLAGTDFRLLGPLEVEREGALCAVPAGRQRALLAALLLRPNQTVPATRLVDQVWGDRAGADRSALNVYVMRLRRTLADDDHALLRAERGGYRIAVDAASVDLHRFRRLCAEARTDRAEGRPDRERDRLHEALALWRGEPMTGISSSVLQAEIVPVLEEERLDALERRFDADLACGAHAEIVRELREVVTVHPFRERFWCQLMLALYRSGRQCEALGTYPIVRRTFADELGVEPGVELRDLHRRILAGDRSLRRPAPPEPAATVAVLASSGATPYVAPAQLPPVAGGFRGRAAELRVLDEQLADPETTSVGLITGPPGVGKTALAVRWAGRQRARWPDGQLFLDLRGHAVEAAVRPIDALAYFLRSMGVPRDRIPTDPIEAAALHRSLTADKRLLVVLDDAAGVDQIRPLLPGGAHCVVVVTSRHRLTDLVARDGARQLVLRPLPSAEARSVVAAMIGEPRMSAEPAAVDRLLRACGRLPSALRRAAAHLASHPEDTLADYVAGLETGRGVIGVLSRDRTVAPRSPDLREAT